MWDKILYMDFAALPVYLIIWYTTIYRKMTKSRSNILFLWVTGAAFFTVLSELIAGILMKDLPVFGTRFSVVLSMEYLYFVMRNATNVLYLFFIFSVTRTWYRIEKLYRKLLLLLPAAGIGVLLLTNGSIHGVFTVSYTRGYARGDLIILVYLLAAFYLVFGTIYLCLHKRTLDFGAFVALQAVYVCNLLAVVIQFVKPELLVECYFTSMTLLFVILFVQRPEKQLDMNTGLLGYPAFREEMLKIQQTGQQVNVIIATISNAEDMKRYLGDTAFFSYISAMGEQVLKFARKEKQHIDLFYERPGSFYLIHDDLTYHPVQAVSGIRDEVRSISGGVMEIGVTPDIRIVVVDFPGEIGELSELFRFGHSFLRFADVDKIYNHASELISQREYRIEAHMDEILNRAVGEARLMITYEPVYAAKEKKQVCAEAVINLFDDVYGVIGEEALVEAAEQRGMIIRLGSYVLDRVFDFAGSEEFDSLGVPYLYISLSVTQCMQLNFTDQIWELRERYKVNPERIRFLIKELLYETMSEVMDENIDKLYMQGYRFALDGYGRGYTSMQRVVKLPIVAVRLDESMITEASSDAGKAVLSGTIQTLKKIPLDVIARGADDDETVAMLADMGCELIQGTADVLAGEKES